MGLDKTIFPVDGNQKPQKSVNRQIERWTGKKNWKSICDQHSVGSVHSVMYWKGDLKGEGLDKCRVKGREQYKFGTKRTGGCPGGSVS